MLSVQSVKLGNSQSFGRRDNSQFEEAEIVCERPRKTMTPERKEALRAAREEKRRAKQEEKMYNQAVDSWSSVRDNLNELENMVPNSVKKPYTWVKTISSGVITGLGVVWASKQAGKITKNALTSQFVKNSCKQASTAFNTIKKPFVTAYSSISEYISKKMPSKAAQKLNDLKSAVTDNKVVTFAKNKVTEVTKRIAKPTFDKVNNITAGVLGTGSGVAAAYDVATGECDE